MRYIIYKIYILFFSAHRSLGFAIRKWLASVNPNIIVSKNVRISKGCTLKATDGGVIEILEGVFLSKNVTLVAQSGRIVLGKNSFVGDYSNIVAKKMIKIGADCLIAERVTIRDQDHNIRCGNTPINKSGFNISPIYVGNDVWICAGAVVLKGVDLNDSSVVAANSVVTKSVSQRVIAGGVPAKIIGERTY